MGKHTEMPRGCHMNPDTSHGIEHYIFVCEGKGAAEVWQLEDGFHVQRRGSTGFPKHFINSFFGEAKARTLAYVTACYAAHPDNRAITADVSRNFPFRIVGHCWHITTSVVILYQAYRTAPRLL
eukprot:Lankesteria_metandrocarpae@DN5456_c0_g1_i25.p1